MLPSGSSILRKAAHVLFAVPVLLAVIVQLALPAVHQLHHAWAPPPPPPLAHAHHDDAHDSHHDAHHHPHHDGETPSHDESTCPTCQLFASLRAFAPLTSQVQLALGDQVQVQDERAPRTFVAQSVQLPGAPPRGPPHLG
jgi:hypothetical protein